MSMLGDCRLMIFRIERLFVMIKVIEKEEWRKKCCLEMMVMSK